MRAALAVRVVSCVALLCGCATSHAGARSAEAAPPPAGQADTARTATSGAPEPVSAVQITAESVASPDSHQVVRPISTLTGEERALLDELEPLFSRLSALGQHGGDACPEICALSSRICDLAALICALAARHPEHPEIARRCTDGRDRCVRARAGAEACACSAPR